MFGAASPIGVAAGSRCAWSDSENLVSIALALAPLAELVRPCTAGLSTTLREASTRALLVGAIVLIIRRNRSPQSTDFASEESVRVCDTCDFAIKVIRHNVP